ncbi:MAG: GDSL-type esterase/lipase family protein [Chloroflexota bacterium]|nr:GDSL-type esterase/lipase family protein [Chloroflexota bacterium]
MDRNESQRHYKRARRLSALFSFSLAFLLLAGTLHSVLSTEYSVLGAAEAPALLLGVGDSLMAGVGASLPDERGEFALVADLMRGRYGPNLRAVNVAVPGETSATLLAPTPLPPPAAGEPTPTPTRPQILRALDELGRLPQGQQAVVLLSIGGNDLQRIASTETPAREAALATFRANLTTIVTRLMEGGQTRALLIQTIYDPFGGDPTAVHSDAWWIEQFNGAIRTVAAATQNVTVVELAAQVRGKEQSLTLGRFDDVHLSNAGHRLAADLLWAAGGFDTTPPDVTLVAPVGGNTPRPVLTVRATVTDDSGPSGVARVVLLADGTEQGELMARPDLAPDTYLGYWDGRLLPGPHTIGVAATDRAGNRREMTVAVTVGAAA